MLDRIFSRPRIPVQEFGSVDYQIYAISQLEKRGKELSNGYLLKAKGYLEWAKRCGLDGKDIVHSCFDLAATLCDDVFTRTENDKKIENWKKLREDSLSQSREPRVIEMNLDPVYFQSILVRDKSFEGRAFDPRSDKNYPDIREGDQIKFTLVNREVWHKDEGRQLGVSEGMVMMVSVGKVLYSPLVHWMYEFNQCDGNEFQPMIGGPSELLYLQSAGIYYSFPGYPEKISENGFVGIEVLDPKFLK